VLDTLMIQARSVRVRLTVWYLVILFATLMVFAVVVYLGVAHDLRAEMDSTLEQVAVTVLDFSSASGPQLDADALPARYAASLYDPAGQLRAIAGTHGSLPLDTADELSRGHAVWRSIILDEDSWRVYARPIMADGRVVALVQVGTPEEPFDRAVDRLSMLLAAVVPLALLLAGGGGLFLAGRAFDPIDRITRTAAEIGGEDLTRRLPDQVVRAPGELGRLAATFNHMLDRLENAFQRQRRFTADASHELRAPLTLLLGQVDVALQRPRSGEEYTHVLRGLREDILRLRRLADVLLALARADARQDLLSPEPLDLGELVQQVVDAMAPSADERQIRLEAQSTPGVVIHGDQARLMQLLLNLVENAFNHTLPGGRVIVSAAPGGNPEMACLSVRDTGCGIAPEHLPHVFERFYRADSARTTGGAGLGLAICSWIVEAHGGQVEVDSELGVGTTFTVSLPRAVHGVVASRRAADQPSSVLAANRSARRGARPD
jgi:heavy metal sensor kinase